MGARSEASRWLLNGSQQTLVTQVSGPQLTQLLQGLPSGPKSDSNVGNAAIFKSVLTAKCATRAQLQHAVVPTE